MLIFDYLIVELHHLLLQKAEALDSFILQDASLVFGAGVLLLPLLQQYLQLSRSARCVVMRLSCLTTLFRHGQHLLNEVSLESVNLELLSLTRVLQISQLCLPLIGLDAPEVDEAIEL